MIPWWVYALGSTLFGVGFFIARKKALTKVHSMNFEASRALTVVLFSLFLIPFVDLNISLKVLGLVYFVSVLATLGILLASKGLRHEEISFITPLGNLKPAFVAVLAFFFLKEAISARQGMGIGILLLAVYVLESNHHFSNLWQPIKHFLTDKYGMLYVFAIFLFSICSIFDKFIIDTHMNYYSYFFLIWIFIAVNFNVVHSINYGFKDTIKCFKKTTYLPFLVGGFSLIRNLLALKALSMTYVSLVVPVLMLSSLFIVLIGGEFFHEKYIWFRVAVSVLILIGAYLVII